jgi:benzodiazapine receptor
MAHEKKEAKHWPVINLKLLAASVILCILIGSSGSLFTTPKISTWYTALNKPFFTPPNWLFAPVWFTLFTLMGFSLYIILDKGLQAKGVKPAIYTFSIQFVLNIAWSFLFFWLESPILGLIGITALWLAIAATIWDFRKLSKTAAWLLFPYMAWVTIAMGLNIGILLLN